MRKGVRQRLLSAAVAALFLLNLIVPMGTLAETAPTTFTVALLGTSDLHGQLMGWNYFTKSPATGLTRVATLVKQERLKYPNNILVDAGDTIQGTPLVYYYNKVDTAWKTDPGKNYPMIDGFKYLNYDAWTLGNHEFNFGLDVLGSIIDKAAGANVDALSANSLDTGAAASDPVTGTYPVWSKVKPYKIKTFKDPDGNDFKVGILGLTTPAIPNWESPQNYEGLQFADIVSQGTKWVKYLKSDPSGPQVDAIIAVIHSGLGNEDPATEPTPYENEVLAFANANPEVNAILSGHTHSAISAPQGANNIFVVQPKNAAANLEEVVLNFAKGSDGKWAMSSIDGASLAASTGVSEDQGLVDLAQPYHQASLDYLKTPVGSASGDFLANGQTIKDTALMDLVNKVQMYYGDADLSVAAPFSATAKIPKGSVTIGDVSSVYIYENFLFTVQVTGAQLRKYLEFSVDRYYKGYSAGDFAVGKNSVPDYNLDVLQGADYTVDLTKPGLYDSKGDPLPGGQGRITKLQFKGKDVQDGDVYKLALNNYRVSGGGSFLSVAGITPQSTDPNGPNYITYDSQKALGDDGQVRSLMIRYFQDMAEGKIVTGKTSVEPSYDNNWQTTPRFYDFVGFTDMHGNIDNYPASGTVKANAALLAGTVNKERADYGDERTVVLAAGDMMQGTPISNVLKGKPVIDIMNQMKFDAMEIGNHEFDWGLDTLNDNLANAQFPFLAANLKLKAGDTDASAAKLLAGSKPYAILDKDGLKIGVIGVILPDVTNIVMPSIIGHFEVEDPAAAVNSLVPQVKAAGAQMVVVLAHIGDRYNYWPLSGAQPAAEPLSEDLAELAKNTSGVAAIIGGHSHTTNYDMVPNAEGSFIPAAIGYANGRGAAVIRLALDENNQVIGAAPNYLDVANRLYSKLTPDPAVQTIVDTAKAAIGPIFGEVIARAEVDMTRSTAAEGNLDSNLGDWAADVTRQAVQADFGFQNSGGLRIDVPKGDITVGQIWTLMPFDNEINVMEMTGAQVKNVLEYMVSGIKAPGHISGLRFTYDPNKPARFSLVNGKVAEDTANSRIMTMRLADGSFMDMNKTYKVAAPDFIATGGDNYPFPANSQNLVNPHILVRDAMIDDLKARKTLSYQPDGRIQFYAAPVITSDLSTGSLGLKWQEFNLGLAANSEQDRLVQLRVTLANPEARTQVKLQYQASDGEFYAFEFDKNGVALSNEFVLRDYSIPAKAKFVRNGQYALKWEIVEMGSNRVLASREQTVICVNSAASIDQFMAQAAGF